MKYLILALFFFTCLPAVGQQVFSFDQTNNIRVGEQEIPLPFAVGINASQYQRMDVNNDGTEDWVVWDINARRILVFVQNGETFTYLPEWSYFFPPDVNGFLILADFDQDGKKDLFTSSPFGIKAYKNITTPGSKFPLWQVAQNFLRLDNGSNLQANNLDIPMIQDVDGDGDLDIASFNISDYLDYYMNTSMDRKGVADIDGFAFPEPWWGRFEFCGCGEIRFGITCEGFPMGRISDSDTIARIQHTGGHSVLYADLDGDDVKDFLVGRDECNNLYFMPNRGTDIQPVFDSFSQELPGYGTLPSFPIFHASFLWEDKLIISSNTSSAAGVFKSDFSENVFILSKGTSALPSQTTFLQSEMLDLGENSRPFFKGLSTSGDLVITANSLLEGKILGMAHLFKTNGNQWEWVEEDYLALSNLNFSDLNYFEYVNSTGQLSFWISGVDTINLSLQRRVFFGSDSDFDKMTELFIPNVTLRALDQIELFSSESKDYLLLARQIGELQLYSFDFQNPTNITLLESDFLGYTDNPATRNLSIHVVPGPKPSLYAINQRGEMVFIEDFLNQTERETVQIKLQENVSAPSEFGRNTWITSLPKPFSEERDLLLGNTAGGLEYLKFQAEGLLPGEEEFLVKIYPNPNRGSFKLIASQTSNVTLISSLGQEIVSSFELAENSELEFTLPLAPGLYIARFTNAEGKSKSQKIVVW